MDETTPSTWILADDLTGAAECATVLGVQGQAVCLCLNVPASPQAAVAYSVNLGTRASQTPQASYDVTKKALEGLLHNEALPYFKVDSTWRSDAVAMALAGMDALDVPFVLLCPAFPQEGRTLHNGIAYLHGLPLQETSLKDDPEHPLSESNVCVLLQQQAQALNRHIQLKTGPNIQLAEIEASAPQNAPTPWIVVPDVATPADLAQLAQQVASLKKTPLCMGSAGFLQALHEHGLIQQNKAPLNAHHALPPAIHTPLPEQNEPRFSLQLISGSMNPTTWEQLDLLHAQFPEIAVLNTASWPKALNWQAHLEEQVGTFLKKRNTVTILCGGSTAQVVLARAQVSQLQWVRALSATCSLWQADEEPSDFRYWVLKSGNMGKADLVLELVKELSDAFQIPLTKHL